MKKIFGFITLFILSFLLLACTPPDDGGGPNGEDIDLSAVNPRNDIYYQLFIRSFADSDGDGVGDFNGITQNLDYIEDLGITAIWMLPFNETDLDWGSYHGYRIKDYMAVNPEYGTMADLENLIEEAGQRDIKIVMDLVINHTSDTHPWFLDARDNPSTSPFRNWYLWTTSTSAFESFPGGMKDLNLDNPAVVQEIEDILEFWINKGIHGFRFDAAKHLFVGNPGTIPANMQAKNYQFLRNLQTFARTVNPDVFFVGEVFDYGYQAYNQYYIGLDSLFDFYAAGQIWEKVGTRSNTYQLISNLERAFDSYRPYNPNYVPSVFIGNHDIDRVASRGEFTGANGLSKLKQAAAVMLTLPGSPHIYYGDELGMTGTAHGGQNFHGQGQIWDQYRRAPFIWGNTSKQTTWLLPHDGSNSAPSVVQSLANPNSLLNYYKTFANIRKDTPALMYGNYFKEWTGNNSFLQGFVRHYQHQSFSQTVLVIHNLSDTIRTVDAQYLEFIYGTSLNIQPYGTLILEIDSSLINNYI